VDDFQAYKVRNPAALRAALAKASYQLRDVEELLERERAALSKGGDSPEAPKNPRVTRLEDLQRQIEMVVEDLQTQLSRTTDERLN
jgi:hypothetical protein